MKLLDMIGLGLGNLRRTKLRSTLTILGVVIGIGALTSMVSFGTGMQRNITQAFSQNDLFTSLFVTSKKIEPEKMAEGDPDAIADALRPAEALTDSALDVIMQIPGVDIAFPEIRFPVRVRIDSNETRTTLQAMPAAMRSYRPFSDLAWGGFFTDDSSHAAVISWKTLREMGLVVDDSEHAAETSNQDSSGEMHAVSPDSIIGKPIQVITAIVDPSRFSIDPMKMLLDQSRMPFKESSTELLICGVMKRAGTFSDGRFNSGITVPVKTAQSIPRLGFSSVWELLGGGGGHGNYNSIYVRARGMSEMEPVRRTIEEMGLNVFSISDELKEIRRGFLIVDSILGAIGTIALVVAALGIVNTMVMSILERTREIGIMKAIGGSENDIRMIFFVEAGTIGVVGAFLGLILGWGVTRIANLIVNAQLLPAGESPVSLFYFPIWLILGAIGFSVVISLAAGMYPAARAARIDPVEALRHD